MDIKLAIQNNIIASIWNIPGVFDTTTVNTRNKLNRNIKDNINRIIQLTIKDNIRNNMTDVHVLNIYLIQQKLTIKSTDRTFTYNSYNINSINKSNILKAFR